LELSTGIVQMCENATPRNWKEIARELASEQNPPGASNSPAN